jgi:hypothetical protein
MEWEPDGLSFKGKSAGLGLPSLFGSSEIDEEVAARKSEDDEIKVGADMVNPMALLSDRFPHISARVVEFWGREKDFDDYMDSLVLKDRSSRTGFPRPVMDALLDLWNDHRDRFVKDQTGRCQWENDNSLHKAFKKLEQEKDFVRRSGLSGAEAATLDKLLTEKAKTEAAAAAEAAEAELAAGAKPLSAADGPIDL